MDIKEVKESSFLDFSSQNERELFIKDGVKVKIETVTSSSDIKSELEDSTYSQNENPHLLRCNEIIKESKMETKIDIKEEVWWLETADSCINDDIKDEIHEDIYSTKQPRLVKELKNNSKSCEMDTKIEIKKEEFFSDDLVSQNERELFQKVITVKSNSNAVLPDDNGGDMAIKTEIKSETSFSEFEVVTCRNNCEVVTKPKIEEQTLDSDFGSQKETEFCSDDPLMKTKNYNSDQEMDNKIEIKVEPWWLQTEMSSICDDIKDEDFPPVTSSRLCEEWASSVVTDKSLLTAAEESFGDTNFNPGKNNSEYEHHKSDVTEMPTAEEHVLSEQSAKCSEGGEMYIRPSHLEQNILLHKSKRSHHCETCGKSFTQLSHLKRHYFIHEGKKPHQCKTCDKSFTELSYLKMHNLIHEGKKPHQCKTCNKSFTRLSYLKMHTLIHEGNKPHQCKTCNKSFTRLSNLKMHTLIHEGKKQHQCKTCEKRFTQLSSLKTHNLIHEGNKPHKCKTCDKSFTRSSDLKKHNLIHERKKLHHYKTCNKSFTGSSDLNRDNLIHEGTKPHKCITCDKSFTRLSSLKRHNLLHESNK